MVQFFPRVSLGQLDAVFLEAFEAQIGQRLKRSVRKAGDGCKSAGLDLGQDRLKRPLHVCPEENAEPAGEPVKMPCGETRVLNIRALKRNVAQVRLLGFLLSVM